jgi:hypothetical protein
MLIMENCKNLNFGAVRFIDQRPYFGLWPVFGQIYKFSMYIMLAPDRFEFFAESRPIQNKISLELRTMVS